jgi:hypothetical protein
MKRINSIFNPNKITLMGRSKIVDTSSGKYVIKEKNKDIKSLYDYLDNRNFDNYPKIIDEFDNNYVYEYLSDSNVPINQKATDMADLLASLHNKTVYFKSIVKDNVKEIYENLDNNIIYLENYYNDLYAKIELEEYMTPSGYLLIRNRTRLNALIKYLKSELEVWYKLMQDKEKERVVYCHNNLTIDHFISKDKYYFISWDKYTIDSPILDLVNLYHNDFGKYDYSNFFTEYLNKFSLLPEEEKLFFITISIPKIVYFEDDEMENTINIGKMIDYIDKTEKLIRPYYAVEKVE